MNFLPTPSAASTDSGPLQSEAGKKLQQDERVQGVTQEVLAEVLQHLDKVAQVHHSSTHRDHLFPLPFFSLFLLLSLSLMILCVRESLLSRGGVRRGREFAFIWRTIKITNKKVKSFKTRFYFKCTEKNKLVFP